MSVNIQVFWTRFWRPSRLLLLISAPLCLWWEPVVFGCSPLLLLLLLLLFLWLCGCRCSVSGACANHSVAYIMLRHLFRCEVIFGTRREITTVFLWLLAVNRLCWLSTLLDEVGGAIMQKGINDSRLLSVSKKEALFIWCPDLLFWFSLIPDGTSVDAQTRFFAMWLEGCARLSVHEAVYRQWFTSAGMNRNARVKLFPVECLTLAGWFTVECLARTGNAE